MTRKEKRRRARIVSSCTVGSSCIQDRRAAGAGPRLLPSPNRTGHPTVLEPAEIHKTKILFNLFLYF